MAQTDVCPTCRRKVKRSNNANRIYWLLLHEISARLPVQEETYSADSWHLYMKSKFLGMEDVRLPNQKIVQQPASSSELDVSEFAAYYEKVSLWAAEHGVWLPE